MRRAVVQPSCDYDHKLRRRLSLWHPLRPSFNQRCEIRDAERHPCADFLKSRVAMINDDVVKCPLCGGFTHIENAELLEALKQPRIREQIEKYVTELLKSPVDELSTVGATQAGRDFQKDVHSWNPCVPMWRRSPKE